MTASSTATPEVSVRAAVLPQAFLDQLYRKPEPGELKRWSDLFEIQCFGSTRATANHFPIGRFVNRLYGERNFDALFKIEDKAVCYRIAKSGCRTIAQIFQIFESATIRHTPKRGDLLSKEPEALARAMKICREKRIVSYGMMWDLESTFSIYYDWVSTEVQRNGFLDAEHGPWNTLSVWFDELNLWIQARD